MIDTQNKRRSVQAYTLGLVRPVADATVGTADRPSLAWFYSGINYSGEVAPAGTIRQFKRGRRRWGL